MGGTVQIFQEMQDILNIEEIDREVQVQLETLVKRLLILVKIFSLEMQNFRIYQERAMKR